MYVPLKKKKKKTNIFYYRYMCFKLFPSFELYSAAAAYVQRLLSSYRIMKFGSPVQVTVAPNFDFDKHILCVTIYVYGNCILIEISLQQKLSCLEIIFTSMKTQMDVLHLVYFLRLFINYTKEHFLYLRICRIPIVISFTVYSKLYTL